MAARPLLLRCKTNNGQHIIENLTGENTVQELKAMLFSITGVDPNCLRILIGFPPKELDLNDDRQKLGEILQQRETLIIEYALDNCGELFLCEFNSQFNICSHQIIENIAVQDTVLLHLTLYVIQLMFCIRTKTITFQQVF